MEKRRNDLIDEMMSDGVEEEGDNDWYSDSAERKGICLLFDVGLSYRLLMERLSCR